MEIFIKKYTEGFDIFLPYLLGDLDGVVKDANWASEISEISSDEIISLARDMSSKRTMISVSWSLTRQDHGEQPFWAAIMLASMLGQIGLPGGGFGFGYSATNHIGGQFSIIPGAAFPQAKNEIDILERAKILKQAEVLLMNDMPLAPILFGISRHLVQEDIEGWVENPSSFHASRYLRRR